MSYGDELLAKINGVKQPAQSPQVKLASSTIYPANFIGPLPSGAQRATVPQSAYLPLPPLNNANSTPASLGLGAIESSPGWATATIGAYDTSKNIIQSPVKSLIVNPATRIAQAGVQTANMFKNPGYDTPVDYGNPQRQSKSGITPLPLNTSKPSVNTSNSETKMRQPSTTLGITVDPQKSGVAGAKQIAGQGLEAATWIYGGKLGATVGGALFGLSQSLQEDQGLRDTAINTAFNAIGGYALGKAVPFALKGAGKVTEGILSTAEKLKVIQQDFVEKLVANGYTREEATKLATQGGFIGKLNPKIEELKLKDEPVVPKPEEKPTLKLPELQKKDNIFIKLRNALQPIKGTDADTQAVYREFVNSKTVAKEMANTETKGALSAIPEKQGWASILERQKGVENANTQAIAKTFADLRENFVKRGIEIPDLGPNYVPQMYKNSPEEVALAVAKYMQDKGVEHQIILDYLAGKDIPEVVSSGLKINPNFSKQRVLPDYATAMKYGLQPEFTHPAQLAGAYRQAGEGALANRKLIQDLIKQGKLVGQQTGISTELAGKLQASGLSEAETMGLHKTTSIPKGMVAVNLSFAPKGLYAEPKLANALNGLFRDEMNLNLLQTAGKYGAKTSRFMQELVLSAGIPKSNENFFSAGVLIRDITRRIGQFPTEPIKATVGLGKDLLAHARANVDSMSIKWFEKKAPMIQKMAKEGIDISNRVGTFEEMYSNVVSKKGWGEALGDGWDKLFNKKTFASYMPQRYVIHFEEAYKGAIKKGLSEAEASKVAAGITRNLDGLTQDMARSKGMQDGLSTAFFAPKFRESIIGVLWDTGKSLTTEIRNPAFKANRQLATGMAITYGMYQALNKKINGDYTWNNESGHENDLRIPLPNGQILFIPFMPSFLSLPRNVISGTTALVHGDLRTATQKFGSIVSMPLQMLSQIMNNRDYFGRDIVNVNDTLPEKLKKWALYVGIDNNHPYLKLVRDLVTPDKDFKKPLYQSIIEALEIPAKIESMDRLSRTKLYEAIDKKTAEQAAIKRKVQPMFDKISKLQDAGNNTEADNLIENMSPEDYAIYKGLKATGTRTDTINTEGKVYNTYQNITKLESEGKQNEADQIIENMSDDEYKAYKLLKKRFDVISEK